jgi:magnesium chelatase family protein
MRQRPVAPEALSTRSQPHPGSGLSYGVKAEPAGKCHCSPDQVARYRRKISGPLLDRIDLHVEVPAVPPDEIAARPTGDASEAIR